MDSLRLHSFRFKFFRNSIIITHKSKSDEERTIPSTRPPIRRLYLPATGQL